jgi:Uma2 family endonuclease
MNALGLVAMYQTDPPRPPQEFLPTMYDLPSENPEEPGLPDEFHDFQPQLLRETFQTPSYPVGEIFIGSDLNLYYDSRNPLWYKRPDWFAVLGVSRLYQEREMRLSYVIWQEGVNPFVVVELLSPGTEKEDLGQSLRDVTKPPTKWEVYERILRVPYYVVFSRYTNELRIFELKGARYQQLILSDERFWFAELELGLGLWQGTYQGINGLWLRWYDVTGNWILTPTERAEEEYRQRQLAQQRAEQEYQRAEQLAQRLRDLGIDPKEL